MLRKLVLRANAIFLGFASLGAVLMLDIPGIFYGKGPLGALGAAGSQAGIGCIEAHGLAFILAILLWRAASTKAWAVASGTRSWHFTGAAIHLLLGSANLFAWDHFVSTDSLAVGYTTTSLHWLFVVLQLLAAAGVLGRIAGDAGVVPAAAASVA